MKIIDEIILNSLHNNRRMLADIRYVPDGSKKPVILFIHGFKGFKDWGSFNLIADYFARKGFVFSKLNLSHNGTTLDNPIDFADLEAFGSNNFTIELDDVEVMLDYLTGNELDIPIDEIDLNKIFLIGHSRGGGLVILKTAEDKRVKGLVTWAAISDLSNRWPEEILQQWKKEGVLYIYNTRTEQNMPLYYQLVTNFIGNKKRLDIPKAAHKISVPWLICHGTNDETLPFSMATDLKSWSMNSELFIIDSATHTFGGSHPWESEELADDSRTLVAKTSEFLERIQ